MTVVRGVDGCKRGWICVSLDLRTGGVSAQFFETAEALFDENESRVTGIDIPIGLPHVHPRKCDRAARELLGPRASSVFPVPVRATLATTSYEEACAASERKCGKRLSRQTYAILAKIRDVDQALRQSADLRERVFEVHPELSFRQWNGGEPMQHPKQSGFGFIERLELVTHEFGDVAERIRHQEERANVADDDILDAIAAAWSARRIYTGEAKCIPEGVKEQDEYGLPMRMLA